MIGSPGVILRGTPTVSVPVQVPPSVSLAMK